MVLPTPVNTEGFSEQIPITKSTSLLLCFLATEKVYRITIRDVSELVSPCVGGSKKPHAL